MKKILFTLLLATLIFQACNTEEETQVVEDPVNEETAEDEQKALGNTISASGTVQDVNLDGMALDGPAVVTIKTAIGATQEIHIPSMGINLCAAVDNIEDVSEIEVGDKVEVRGDISEENTAITPCVSEEHYFRVAN